MKNSSYIFNLSYGVHYKLAYFEFKTQLVYGEKKINYVKGKLI
jgi:hypothetical protein